MDDYLIDPIVVEIKDQVIKKLSEVETHDLEKNQFDATVNNLIASISKDKRYVLNRDQFKKVAKISHDHVYGFGVLQGFIDDQSVNDILINGYESIYIEKAGRLSKVDGSYFQNEEEVRRYASILVAKVNKRVDESIPYCDARLPGVGRINVIVPPIGLSGTCISIRKASYNTYSLQDLFKLGALTQEIAAIIAVFSKARGNIIVSGGTGSGKTTLLNAISEHIPSHLRILTLEDTAELNILQEHVVKLETRPASSEGRGLVTTRQLLINALRMRPDIIIVGECRGEETYDMLQAMNTGHDGSMSTLHANNCRDAINRMVAMSMMAADNSFPVSYIQKQVVESVDIIIHVSRLSSGERRIVEISSLMSMEGSVPVLNTVAKYNQSKGCYDLAPLSTTSRLYKKIEDAGLLDELKDITKIFGE